MKKTIILLVVVVSALTGCKSHSGTQAAPSPTASTPSASVGFDKTKESTEDQKQASAQAPTEQAANQTGDEAEAQAAADAEAQRQAQAAADAEVQRQAQAAADAEAQRQAEEQAAQQEAPATVSYKNCTEVRAAGAAPLHRGEPGYSSHLDRDGDGVACE